MKKFILILIKVGLGGIFLYNIGLFNINYTRLFGGMEKTVPYNHDNELKLIRYVNEKIHRAEAKSSKYGPFDYFRDLYETERFAKTLTGTTNYHMRILPLLDCFSRNVNRRYFSSEEISRAQTYFNELKSPGITAKKLKETEEFRRNAWPDLCNWFLHFYLENLPLAFILFLLWWYKEKGTLRISNPLSFVISVIFYPIVIGLVIYEVFSEGSRYYLAEAELRRTKKKMFAILSPDEIADLRRFAKSRGLTLDDWRNYLGNQGLKPQGIMISSLVVTILLTAIPRISLGQEKGASRAGNSAIENVMMAYCSSNQPPPDSNLQDQGSGMSSPTAIAYFFDWLYEFDWSMTKPTFIKPTTKKVYLPVVIRKIEHVPYFSF